MPKLHSIIVNLFSLLLLFACGFCLFDFASELAYFSALSFWMGSLGELVMPLNLISLSVHFSFTLKFGKGSLEMSLG